MRSTGIKVTTVLTTPLHRAPSPLREEQELFSSMMSEEEPWTTHSRGTSTGDQVRPNLQITNFRFKLIYRASAAELSHL